MMQEKVNIYLVAVVVAFIIGILIGWLMGRRAKGAVAEKSAQAELAAYKAAVSAHFGKTADLVDNLTSSYKDVFEHLGKSAHALLSEEELKKHLQHRAEKTVTLTYATDVQQEAKAPQQPTEGDDEKAKSPETVESTKGDTTEEPTTVQHPTQETPAEDKDNKKKES